MKLSGFQPVTGFDISLKNLTASLSKRSLHSIQDLGQDFGDIYNFPVGGQASPSAASFIRHCERSEAISTSARPTNLVFKIPPSFIASQRLTAKCLRFVKKRGPKLWAADAHICPIYHTVVGVPPGAPTG